MSAPIDGGGPNPYPPPPEGWRPRRLARVDEAELERAMWLRLDRIAQAYGVSTHDARDILLRELTAPVKP